MAIEERFCWYMKDNVRKYTWVLNDKPIPQGYHFTCFLSECTLKILIYRLLQDSELSLEFNGKSKISDDISTVFNAVILDETKRQSAAKVLKKLLDETGEDIRKLKILPHNKQQEIVVVINGTISYEKEDEFVVLLKDYIQHMFDYSSYYTEN